MLNSQGYKLLGEDITEERTKHQTQLSLGQIPEGMYFLQVMSKEGVVTKKVVKR